MFHFDFSGWQELRLDVPPPAMLKNRRSRDVRSKEDQPERHTAAAGKVRL